MLLSNSIKRNELLVKRLELYVLKYSPSNIPASIKNCPKCNKARPFPRASVFKSRILLKQQTGSLKPNPLMSHRKMIESAEQRRNSKIKYDAGRDQLYSWFVRR